jgi:hypothetical protein
LQKSEKQVNQAADLGDISNGMTDEVIDKLMQIGSTEKTEEENKALLQKAVTYT